jgi:hypothetical protein
MTCTSGTSFEISSALRVCAVFAELGAATASLACPAMRRPDSQAARVRMR